MSYKIVLLPGDGIGPEVTAGARLAMERAASVHGIDLQFETFSFGGEAIDIHGDPLPAETLQACLDADAVFLGAVGGPKWDDAPRRPEKGLLELRQEMAVFANLRPMKVLSGMETLSPLKDDLAKGADCLIIRELTGGVYFGSRKEGMDKASDVCEYSREEVIRIARIAFEAARGRRGIVTSVDKANVLATSRLWRAAVNELHRDEYSDVELRHQLVDSMAMKLITHPKDFDVILTENMFGDILSDEASVIAGSIGLSPSASIGASGPGLYEPIHGSAPDIAGQDKANPISAILSAAMLMRHSLKLEDLAKAIETAVETAIQNGLRTGDLGGTTGCVEAAQIIADTIASA